MTTTGQVSPAASAHGRSGPGSQPTEKASRPDPSSGLKPAHCRKQPCPRQLCARLPGDTKALTRSHPTRLCRGGGRDRPRPDPPTQPLLPGQPGQGPGGALHVVPGLLPCDPCPQRRQTGAACRGVITTASSHPLPWLRAKWLVGFWSGRGFHTPSLDPRASSTLHSGPGAQHSGVDATATTVLCPQGPSCGSPGRCRWRRRRWWWSQAGGPGRRSALRGPAGHGGSEQGH